MKLEFVSYDGAYPNLCSGTLKMKLDGAVVTFPDYCLSSDGSVWFDDDCNENVEEGDWTIGIFPENFPEELKEEAEKIVNENVRKGCCGGCV